MHHPGHGPFQPHGHPAHGPHAHVANAGLAPQAGPAKCPGYPPQQQAGPAYSPGYPPQQKGYAQQPAGYGRKLPDSAHEHALHQEASQKNCKVCQKPIGGTPAYVCHNCELVLCYNCGNAIFYGNKAKQVHPHTLALRVRNAWKCDLCKQHFKGTASFYCKGCDFDACSKCYVGF